MVALELRDRRHRHTGELRFSVENRAAAQQRLTGLTEHYPTIERSRLLLDDDWDGTFRKGLDFLLDGLAPRDGGRMQETGTLGTGAHFPLTMRR